MHWGCWYLVSCAVRGIDQTVKRTYNVNSAQWTLWRPVLAGQLNWVLAMGLDIRYAIVFLY